MTEIKPGEYVDTYVNLPSTTRQPQEDMDPNLREWFIKTSPDLLGGVTTEQWVDKMTAAGIEKALISINPKAENGAMRYPTLPTTPPESLDDFRVRLQEVAAVCDDYPGRIYGSCNIDPNHRMDAVRMVEIAVKEFDFRAVRLFGSLTNCRPNDPLCYPIYTKCIELGIPVVINLGFPGPLRYAKYQQPIDIDEVCVTYPELVVVGTHIGHPWHLETVALLQKHANFRLMTSGFVPKYIPAEIIHTLNTRAKHKVMFAADYPVQEFQRCVDEALKLDLREGVLRRYMRDNALETFRMD